VSDVRKSLTIVLGYDGSESARRGVERVGQLAVERPAVVVVAVAPEVRSAGLGTTGSLFRHPATHRPLTGGDTLLEQLPRPLKISRGLSEQHVGVSAVSPQLKRLARELQPALASRLPRLVDQVLGAAPRLRVCSQATGLLEPRAVDTCIRHQPDGWVAAAPDIAKDKTWAST
jgi:hypothetical protein